MRPRITCNHLVSVPNWCGASVTWFTVSPSISSGARPLDAMRISSASGIRSIFTFTALSVLYLPCHSVARVADRVPSGIQAGRQRCIGHDTPVPNRVDEVVLADDALAVTGDECFVASR